MSEGERKQYVVDHEKQFFSILEVTFLYLAGTQHKVVGRSSIPLTHTQPLPGEGQRIPPLDLDLRLTNRYEMKEDLSN